MSNTMSTASDPDLKVVSINDFSPGIYRYAQGELPLTYSTHFPPGSASFAARCMNKPGVGLVPFYQYSNAQSWTNAAPLVPETSSYATHSGYIFPVCMISSYSEYGLDQLYVASTGQLASTSVYGMTWGVWWGVGPSDNLLRVSVTPTPDYVYYSPFGLYLPSITKTRSSYGNQTNVPQVWFTDPSVTTVLAAPGWVANTPCEVVQILDVTTLIGLYASSERVLAFAGNALQGGDGINSVIPVEFSTNEDIYFTDPVASQTFNAVPNFYAVENYSGYGSWGTISTGELFLVKAQGGAVVVSGDPGYPSSAIFLPGVKGTGAVIGPATPCQVGLLYVTESDGVWAWNGSNVSVKVSSQIPDDATLYAGPAAANLGNGSFEASNSSHAAMGNLVFFGNNWVFDSENNSWWLCEDPAIVTFNIFAASTFRSDRLMYALPGAIPIPSGTTYPSFAPYMFDRSKPAISWEWVSNPISTGTGRLSSLYSIEIVASNPTSNWSQITVTPTCPVGQTPYSNQNVSQPVIFRIPPMTVAWRGEQRVGYQDYNICVEVVAATIVSAANLGNHMSAPILHEINLGFSDDNTSGISTTPQTTYWVWDDPVYGLWDETTVWA